MINVKETAMKEKFENFRVFLDSNYNSSHARLSDKLTDLSKDVASLKDNLSKHVRKAVSAKLKPEKSSNTGEGKMFYSHLFS